MKKEELFSLKDQAVKAFTQAASSSELYEAKVRYLGKNGLLPELMKKMASLSKDERPQFGQWINEVKTTIEEKFASCDHTLKQKELSEKLLTEKLDLTLP